MKKSVDHTIKTVRMALFALSMLMCCSCAAAEKKEVKASEILQLIRKEKPIQMVDKIITGDLDFSTADDPFIVTAGILQCEIRSAIFFSNCVFTGKVTAGRKLEQAVVQSSFKNNLVLTGCEFRGEVDFTGAAVQGMVNFGKSVFRESANFNNLTAWARDCYFTEMVAEKAFTMIYALIAGNLYFLDARFGGNAGFQEITVRGKLSMNNAVFGGRADFGMMEVSGSASFNRAAFEKTANFAAARMMHTADFIDTSFSGAVSFDRTFFLNTANFDGADSSKLDFDTAYFIIKR